MNSIDWWEVGLILTPMLVAMGALFEKVRQIEKRLNNNGTSIPARCQGHQVELAALDARVEKLELDPLGD